jgi:hypothetical protein
MTRILLLVFIHFICCSCGDAGSTTTTKDYSNHHIEALSFCKQKKFCEDYYFLVDLSIHSGKNRFYVYDFKRQKITDQNLVTHGSCDIFNANDSKYKKAQFSNLDKSHCSSLGKYKVGKQDYSSWGIKVKYWLEGLDETNSNAQNRVVVLHSWNAVADEEIFPRYSPLSWGCPAVSDNFMRMLDTKLQETERPVLLWIID